MIIIENPLSYDCRLFPRLCLFVPVASVIGYGSVCSAIQPCIHICYAAVSGSDLYLLFMALCHWADNGKNWLVPQNNLQQSLPRSQWAENQLHFLPTLIFWLHLRSRIRSIFISRFIRRVGNEHGIASRKYLRKQTSEQVDQCTDYALVRSASVDVRANKNEQLHFPPFTRVLSLNPLKCVDVEPMHSSLLSKNSEWTWAAQSTTTQNIVAIESDVLLYLINVATANIRDGFLFLRSEK